MFQLTELRYLTNVSKSSTTNCQPFDQELALKNQSKKFITQSICFLVSSFHHLTDNLEKKLYPYSAFITIRYLWLLILVYIAMRHRSNLKFNKLDKKFIMLLFFWVEIWNCLNCQIILKHLSIFRSLDHCCQMAKFCNSFTLYCTYSHNFVTYRVLASAHDQGKDFIKLRQFIFLLPHLSF